MPVCVCEVGGGGAAAMLMIFVHAGKTLPGRTLRTYQTDYCRGILPFMLGRRKALNGVKMNRWRGLYVAGWRGRFLYVL